MNAYNYCGISTYFPRHFKVYEFVDSDTYNKFGENSLWMIDNRMLWTMDRVRELFNKPVIINNWAFAGNRKWSGIRYSGTPYYSKTSQHSFGRAIDFLVDGINASEVRKYIINNPNKEEFKYITTIEDFEGMEWIHIDCRTLHPNQKRYFIIKP